MKRGARPPGSGRRAWIRLLPSTPDARRLAKVAAGGDPADHRDTAREQLTVRQLGERYLAGQAEPKKKPSSAADDRRMLEKYIVPAFGSRRVAQVRRSDIEKLHVALREKPTTRVRSSQVFGIIGVFGLMDVPPMFLQQPIQAQAAS